MSNSQLLAVAQEVEEETANTTGNLMPPPPAPPAASAVAAETSICSGRPQRAAKLKSEKNLKEPSLIAKMRRPSQNEEVKIKLESEQRASQMHLSDTSRINHTETAANAAPAPVDTNTPAEEPVQNTNSSLRVMVKREKLSNDSSATTAATLEASRVLRSDTTVSVTNTTTANNTTTAENTAASGNTTATGQAKKGRKKKEGHRPIKVERFSELDNNLPVASRTRKGSTEVRNSQASEAPPQRSIYEDAVEEPPTAAVAAQAAVNETVTLGGVAMSEATFNIPTGSATMTVADHVPNNATFQVEAGGADDDQEDSMETARQGSLPKTGRQSSIMTEDDSPQLEKAKEKPSSKYQLPAEPTTYKGIKMPARTHELFK